MAQIADESYMKMIEAQGAQGQDPADAKLWVKFEERPAKDEIKSAEAGRPIFAPIEWIRIMVPGERDEIERPATDMDRARFSKQYQHWKATGQEAVIGTPLESWPMVTRSQVEELKFFKIATVEQLAAVPDVLGAKFMGINDLKAKAKLYIDAAAGAAPIQMMKADLAKKDEEIATLQKALKDQSEKIDQLLKQRR